MRDQFEVTSESGGDNPEASTKRGARFWCGVIYFSTTGILILMTMIVLRPPAADTAKKQFPNSTSPGNYSVPICTDACRLNLVESLPAGLLCDNNSVSHRNTHDSWLELIDSAQSSIDILSYHFELSRVINTCFGDRPNQNEDLMAALVAAGRDRGVTLRILLDDRSSLYDPEYLSEKANAQIRRVNFARLFGKGIMHAKMLAVDRTHFYVGSADMSGKSVAINKELGLLAADCFCLANDVAKIFDGYWELPEDGTAPNTWPESLATGINIDNPMHLTSDGIEYRTFAASSPTATLANGRTYDVDALLYSINKAEKFIYVATVKYFPLQTYKTSTKYWSIIDDALREAAIERKVHIRLLINRWEESSPSEKHFLKSLTDLTESYENVKIEAKFFSSPAMEKPLRFLNATVYRVLNHHRYIVTDTAAYISTSNFAGEFFDSAGIGLVFEDVGRNNTNSIRHQLEDVFQRDWTSRYAYSLDTKLRNAKNSSTQAD